MTPDEINEIRAQAQAVRDRFDKAHTAENFERLQAEFEKRGCKLTGTMRRKTSFKLTDSNGVQISGLSLATLEEMLDPKPADQN